MSWTQFLFSIQGRVNRGPYWQRLVLPIVVIGIVLTIADTLIFGGGWPNETGFLAGLWSLLVI